MNPNLKENQITIFGVCVLLGLVVSAGILGSSLINFKKYDEQKISVTGAASKMITSNSATWSGHVTCRGNTMAQAYTQLKQHVAKVRAYLMHQGLDSKALQDSPVTANTLYTKDSRGDNTNQIEGFEL